MYFPIFSMESLHILITLLESSLPLSLSLSRALRDTESCQSVSVGRLQPDVTAL